MIEIKRVQEAQKTLLWNMLQKYLYEMTNYDDEVMDENGNYQYKYFDQYFLDEKRVALLIYSDETIVGFALINQYSYIKKSVDYAFAEFTIFPMYRKRGIATEAVKKIFSTYKGEWEIKYCEKNIAARGLWNKVTARFNQRIFHINNKNSALLFKVG